LKILPKVAAALLAAWSDAALAYPTSEDLAEIRAVIARQVDSPCRAAARAPAAPVRLAFLDLLVLGDEVVQEARLVDRRGTVWVAHYALQRSRDGRWHMSGCQVVPPVKSIPA
jgi:Domain of unknown function (DUF4864)